MFVTAWLAQEADRSGLHGACPQVFIGISSEENMGMRGPIIDYLVGAAEPRQARYKDKNNVIAATLTRLTNRADTNGRIMKAFGDGP